ncbi:ROK family protein [Jeotgalibaca caeni]|uniref:ROK family protein n=1 Tax=Jeotgalibaca caeni TaxID=3028623 RepID=UPI00237D8679|nr:ROK family protein [Jeotgalibaca caeni]MDE1549092.1 ROK family protein [Jeotgalibaca caeni]
MTYVCFDVGGTAVKYGLFTSNGELFEKGEYPTQKDDKKIFYQQMLQKIHLYEQTERIEGIGISFPGFINPYSGEAITAGALYPLYGENIVNVLREELPYPIAIENDANCAALAEMLSGNAQGLEHFVLITIGTGIGGAIVLNGELFRGNTFRAGEFGMMHIDVGNRPYATAHDVAATSSLVRSYKEKKGIAPEAHVDARTIMIEKETDPEVAILFRNWLKYLGAVVFNSATFFNPEKILLGGGISGDPTLILELEKELALSKDWKDIKTIVQNCKYYNEAGLRGAYALIQEKVALIKRGEFDVPSKT